MTIVRYSNVAIVAIVAKAFDVRDRRERKNLAIVAEALDVRDRRERKNLASQHEVKSQNCSNSKEAPDATPVVGTLCIVWTGPFAPTHATTPA